MPQKLVAPKRLKLEKIAQLTLQEIRYLDFMLVGHLSQTFPRWTKTKLTDTWWYGHFLQRIHLQVLIALFNHRHASQSALRFHGLIMRNHWFYHITWWTFVVNFIASCHDFDFFNPKFSLMSCIVLCDKVNKDSIIITASQGIA